MLKTYCHNVRMHLMVVDKGLKMSKIKSILTSHRLESTGNKVQPKKKVFIFLAKTKLDKFKHQKLAILLNTFRK